MPKMPNPPGLPGLPGLPAAPAVRQPLVRRKAEPVLVDIDEFGVRLRTLQPELVTKTIAQWLTDPAVMEGLNAPKGDQSLDAFRAYAAHFDNYARNLLLIEREGHPAGIILLEIDPRHWTGSLHVIIGEADKRNRGIAGTACILAVRHAFGDRKVGKLTFMPLERNTVAIGICETFGLTLEGTLREHRIDGRTGERLDQRVYGMTRGEFDRARASGIAQGFLERKADR